jgi:3-isopropylmalate/(R)-2-methylmalate dehydratase small subunit
MRFSSPGQERAEFVLNQQPWRQAAVLLTGPNFGCGSSREHAVWGLRELGIRCIIGTTFGGIFADNCARNGVPAIAVAPQALERLMALASDPARCEMVVDLQAMTITTPADGVVLPFEFDPLRRRMLLEGLDAVGLTLQHAQDIRAFEQRYLAERPWA